MVAGPQRVLEQLMEQYALLFAIQGMLGMVCCLTCLDALVLVADLQSIRV